MTPSNSAERFGPKEPINPDEQAPLGQPRYQPLDLDLSAPLENSVPLEAPRQIYIAAPLIPRAYPAQSPPVQLERPTVALPELEATAEDNANISLDPVSLKTSDEQRIQLLEERLLVNQSRRKIGEVIVRKQIETRIVEVPIRREKLIVEQVSPAAKQIAVVDLGEQGESELAEAVNAAHLPLAEARFTSASAAIQFLQDVVAHSHSDQHQVLINLTLPDVNLQALYQQLERSSAKFRP